MSMNLLSKYFLGKICNSKWIVKTKKFNIKNIYILNRSEFEGFKETIMTLKCTSTINYLYSILHGHIH